MGLTRSAVSHFDTKNDKKIIKKRVGQIRGPDNQIVISEVRYCATFSPITCGTSHTGADATSYKGHRERAATKLQFCDRCRSGGSRHRLRRYTSRSKKTQPVNVKNWTPCVAFYTNVIPCPHYAVNPAPLILQLTSPQIGE